MSHRITTILDAVKHLEQRQSSLVIDGLAIDDGVREVKHNDLFPINMYEDLPSVEMTEASGELLNVARSRNFFLEGMVSPDRLAWYVSFRYRQRPWGIIYSESAIIHLVHSMVQQFGSKFGDVIELCNKLIYAVTIHELFHYRVDVFALNLEMALGTPIYLPYKTNVYTRTFHTPECLEEALANASTLVRSLAPFKECLYYWYSRCRDGYRQFDLYDSPQTFDRGLMRLMGQIIEGTTAAIDETPRWFPNLDWDDPYYGSSLVPRHSVERAGVSDRLRTAMFARPYRCGKL
jgi:hypothetical protein